MAKKQHITVEGVTYKSLSEACKKYNLKHKTIYARLYVYKWSIEEAFELVYRNNKKQHITVEGVTYKSLSEACKKYNLKHKTIYARLYVYKWSIEEAFELVYRNNNKNPITVEGVTYKSLSEACKKYNKDYMLIRTRLQRRWSIEEAFELIDISHRLYNNDGITIDGIYFETLLKACEYYNIKYKTVLARLNKLGWSIEEAFELVYRDNRCENIILDGIEYKSISDAAKKYGLKCNLINERIRHGWSIEEAFELVDISHRLHNNDGIIIDGIYFETFLKACEHYNMNSGTVYGRIKKGWDINSAFTIPILHKGGKRGNPITVNHIKFESLREACRYYELNYNTIHDRINKHGWSIEEAFELIERSHKLQNKNGITVNGIHFETIKKACEYYNLKYSIIIQRLNRGGWSIEEAFELVPRKRIK